MAHLSLHVHDISYMFAMALLFQCRELLQRQLPTCDSGAWMPFLDQHDDIIVPDFTYTLPASFQLSQ